MGKPTQDIEDISFILNEIKKHSSMTVEDFRELVKKDSFYLFYTLDLSSGKHIQIGREAALRFKSIAERHCKLFQHTIDVSSLELAIKLSFAKTFIEKENPIEIKFVDRMLSKAVKETQENHKMITHYIPCVITRQGEPSEFKIGPVRFLTTKKFFKDFGSKIEDDCASYGIKESRIINKIYDYYKAYIWIAEVTVQPCDNKISEKRALHVVQGSLDVLKLFFHHSHGHDLQIGSYTGYYKDRAKITSTPDGMFHPEFGSHVYGVPANPMWFSDIRRNSKWFLACVGNAVEGYLKPEAENMHRNRWLRALYWYGQAVSEDRPAEQLVKYVVALECLAVTPQDGKEEVTDIVTRRTALLIAKAYKDDVYEKIKSKARKIYRKRSDLMHGRISPITQDINSIVSLAHDIVPKMMLITLDMFWCLELNGRNSPQDLFDEYRSLEMERSKKEK